MLEVAAEKAPQSLRERVCRTLLDERVREELAEDEEIATEDAEEAPVSDAPEIVVPDVAAKIEQVPPYLAKLRYIVPLAAAATIALVGGTV